MEKIIINGVEFCNFGEDLLTKGMQKITCYPMPKGMIQDVLDGKYPGVFLNPSVKCTTEFFGFLGTEEQYKEVYEEQRESQISKRVLQLVHWNFEAPVEEWRAARKKAIEEYKDWWL